MDNHVLTSVFMRLRSGLKAKARSILGNDQDADDALQEAFCRLWSARSSIADEAHAQGAANVAVKNVSIDMARRAASHPQSEVDLAEPLAVAPSDDQSTDDALRRVEGIMGKLLSDRDREILHKREMYGYEFDELATEYGISAENVRAIVSRARRAIRDYYTENVKNDN